MNVTVIGAGLARCEAACQECGTIFMKLSERIQEQRIEKGKTQQEMADFLGVKIRVYQYYESGGRKPTLDNLIVLADYFDVSLDYLVGPTDNPM